jgi:putative flippase GtrA
MTKPTVYQSYKKTFKYSIVGGIGWAIGVTLGLAFVSSVVVGSLSAAGGLPLIGSFIANIVEATNEALGSRNPLQ